MGIFPNGAGEIKPACEGKKRPGSFKASGSYDSFRNIFYFRLLKSLVKAWEAALVAAVEAVEALVETVEEAVDAAELIFDRRPSFAVEAADEASDERSRLEMLERALTTEEELLELTRFLEPLIRPFMKEVLSLLLLRPLMLEARVARLTRFVELVRSSFPADL